MKHIKYLIAALALALFAPLTSMADAVAKIGTVEYATLEAAFAAAKSGDTVTLLANLTETDPANSGIAYNMTGVTFDLNTYTYSQYNFAHIFEGTGGVIKNGKMVCLNGGSYALFIGDSAETTSFTVEDVEMTGGINAFNATGIVLKNLKVHAQNYYAVWSDESGDVTIESGTYEATDSKLGNALFNASRNAGKVTITGGEFKALDNALMGSAGGTLTVAGGTFDKAVDAVYCAAGYAPTAIGDGVYGVADAIQVVSATGATSTYHSFAEATAAAKSGDTIKLLADVVNTDYTVANVINIKLASGVTLDGDGKTLGGNIKVTVAAAGDVVIKNVNFKDIHNAQEVSAAQRKKYNFSADKVGTLSAIYAPTLAGKLAVSGCVFENCDWDAMQISPAEGAVIDIRDNIFKTSTSATVKEPLRYVHVEMAYKTGVYDYEGTDITLTMTDNQFFGAPLDSSCGIFWLGKESTLDLAGNYFENPDLASLTLSDTDFNHENHCEQFYPARSVAGVDKDDLAAVALIVKDAYNATAYASLSAALSAASEGASVKLIADTTEDVEITKNITLDLGGKTLTGTATANKATLTIASGATATVKNGTVLGKASYYAIQNKGTATFEDLVATAGNTNSSMLDNAGTLVINSGTYTGGMDTIKNEPNASLTIKDGTFENAYGENNAHTGVIYNLGSVEILDGEFTQKATSPMWAYPHVVMTASENGSKPSTLIKGGTFTSTLKNWKGTILNHDGEGSAGCTVVSGGSFNMKVSNDYCEPGYCFAETASGVYGVTEAIQVLDADGAVVSTYHSLADAFKAAQSGQTVQLLADLTETDAKGDAIPYIMTGVTLDLNGKTYTHYNYAHVFQGTDGVIKNGKIVCAPYGTAEGAANGSYALFIGYHVNDGGKHEADATAETTSFTVQDVELTGGINISHATGVVLDNLTVNGTKYYAVWTEEGSSVTIKGGTYTTGALALLNGAANTSIAVEDGTFYAKDKSLVYNSGVVPSISGGTFDKAVDEKYCAVDYVPQKNTDGTYGVQRIKADVIFDALGGQIADAGSVTLNQENRTYSNFPTSKPTRENYVFKGWTLGVTNNAPVAVSNGAWVAEGEHTLYARWEIASTVPTSAEDTFKYEENGDGTVTITGFGETGFSGGALIIPDTIAGNPVTAIAKAAFANSTASITSVTLPMFLETIGRRAFSGVSTLTSIAFTPLRAWQNPSEAGALTIGEYAFTSTGLTSLTLPEDVVAIESYAFADCRMLAEVTILGAPEVGTRPFRRAGIDTSSGGTIVHIDPALAANATYFDALVTDVQVVKVKTGAVVDGVEVDAVSAPSAVGDSIAFTVSVKRAVNWGDVDTAAFKVEYRAKIGDTATILEPTSVERNANGSLTLKVPSQGGDSGFFRVIVAQ